jgi:hypothetical protein
MKRRAEWQPSHSRSAAKKRLFRKHAVSYRNAMKATDDAERIGERRLESAGCLRLSRKS